MIIAGNGIYMVCLWCGKLVKLNKFIFGSLHVCLSEEERKEKLLRSQYYDKSSQYP